MEEVSFESLQVEIEVILDPFNEYTIAPAPNITLAALYIKTGLQLQIKSRGRKYESGSLHTFDRV